MNARLAHLPAAAVREEVKTIFAEIKARETLLSVFIDGIKTRVKQRFKKVFGRPAQRGRFHVHSKLGTRNRSKRTN
jgi:hypothetical protein